MLAIRGLVEGLVEAVIGLILVQLTYRLLALDRPRVNAELGEKPRALREEAAQIFLPEESLSEHRRSPVTFRAAASSYFGR